MRVVITIPSSKPTSSELLSVNGTTNGDSLARLHPEKHLYLLRLVYFSLFLSHIVLFKHAELLSSSKVPFFQLSFQLWNMVLNILSPSSLTYNTSCMFQFRHCFLCKAFSDCPGWSGALLKCSHGILISSILAPNCTILKHGWSTCFTAQLNEFPEGRVLFTFVIAILPAPDP